MTKTTRKSLSYDTGIVCIMDDALAVLDHIASRVTASVLTGLGCGAAYSSYKGVPLVKTSMTTAFSFALVSTACFTMERVANIIIRQSSILLNDDDDDDDGKPIIDSNDKLSATTRTTQSNINLGLHYGSHGLGGLLGGGIVGFLFQGKPMAGAMLLTPMMLAVGKIEASADEYRTERLQQLNLLREQEKRGP